MCQDAYVEWPVNIYINIILQILNTNFITDELETESSLADEYTLNLSISRESSWMTYHISVVTHFVMSIRIVN